MSAAEAIRSLRDKTKRASAENPYQDWWYSLLEVKVFKVSFMDGTHLYVPRKTGEKIQKGMVTENNSSTIQLGSGVWRVYEFKSVVPAKIRFVELSDWAKHKMLEEQPNLLDEKYSGFSPELKKKICELQKGKNLDDDLRVSR